MRVDSFRNIAASMAEYPSFRCLIGTSIVEQRGHGMPAVMGSVAISPDTVHDGPPEDAVAAVRVGPS